MNWETVIGLEVHVQLSTQSKLFSGAPTTYGALPNTQTSFIDAGFPGVLPVLNREAVYMAIHFGLAIDAEINNYSYFERKNYFYPDLPKGYQISQNQCPIVGLGHLNIETTQGTKTVTIVRAHLEEDAGKSLHAASPDATGIDLNRAGLPLLEIVTSPCLSTAEEAVAYLKTLHQLVQFLGICDGNMQEGSFRCDVNLSLRRQGETQLGVRTELKNLNSFRFIEKAIRYEQARHQDALESGQTLLQETRLYSPETNSTYAMRQKENAQDYRYFPDPDLLPIELTENEMTQLRNSLPPLPQQIKTTLLNQGIHEDDVAFLLTDPALFSFFTETQTHLHQTNTKQVLNWLKGAYSAAMNETGLTFKNPPVGAKLLAEFLEKITQQQLPANISKILFAELVKGQTDLEQLITNSGYQPLKDDAALEALVADCVLKHPQQAAQYRAGKDKMLGFFVGQIMKATQGRANPATVNQLLQQYLKSDKP